MDVCYFDLEPIPKNNVNLELYVLLLGFSLLMLRFCYLLFSRIEKDNFKIIRYNGGNRFVKINFSTSNIKKKVCKIEFQKNKKFSRIFIRDEIIRIIDEIDIINEFSSDIEYLIKQRFVKPKDFFEVYALLIIKNYSFDIILHNHSNYNIDFFEVLNVIKKGPHLNLKNFTWEMSFDNPEKPFVCPYFSINVSKRENSIKNDIILIKYDVKIIQNQFEIPEKNLYYLAQLFFK
jgi:hypothetical protein